MLNIVTRRTRTFDMHFPFQLFRHSSLAKRARQWIYYLAIGKEGYPFVFRQVEEGEELPHATSPHIYIHIPFCSSICIHCPYNKVVFRNEMLRLLCQSIGKRTQVLRSTTRYTPHSNVVFWRWHPKHDP